MDKLEKLEQLIGVLDKDTVTQEEFVASFEQVLEFVKKIKESNDEHMEEVSTRANEVMDRCMMKMENAYASEWSKIKSKVDTLRNGSDYILTKEDKQEIAGLIDVPVVEKIIEKTETIIEKPITNEVPNRDTAEDIRNKLELLDGDERLKKEAISGLEDVIGQKDLDFALGVLDKRTQFLVNKPPQITVSTTAPDSPYVNQLWVDLS